MQNSITNNLKKVLKACKGCKRCLEKELFQYKANWQEIDKEVAFCSNHEITEIDIESLKFFQESSRYFVEYASFIQNNFGAGIYTDCLKVSDDCTNMMEMIVLNQNYDS